MVLPIIMSFQSRVHIQQVDAININMDIADIVTGIVNCDQQHFIKNDCC